MEESSLNSTLLQSDKDASFRFILDNGPDTLLNNIWELVQAFQFSYEQDTSQREKLIFIMIGEGALRPFSHL